jgi:hypothetical protein
MAAMFAVLLRKQEPRITRDALDDPGFLLAQEYEG